MNEGNNTPKKPLSVRQEIANGLVTFTMTGCVCAIVVTLVVKALVWVWSW